MTAEAMRRTYLLIAILAALAVGGGWYFYYRIDTVVRNAYAVWWVADMVIHHLESTDDRWPTGWDDLRDDYEALTRESGRPWTFEELSRRVEVDWAAEPLQLARRARELQPFRVVRLADGSDHHYRDHEPNRMPADYFRGSAENGETPAGQ